MAGKPSIPSDVQAENRIAKRLREHFRSKFFGQLRYFSALRREAPGIIVKFLIGCAISAVALVAAFHDLNAQGIFEVAGVSLATVVVVGMSFWFSAILWRSLGLGFRNALRFLVSRLPALLATTLFVASVAASLLRLGPTTSTPEAVSATVPTAPADASESESANELGQPPSFEGDGWFILNHDRVTYDKVVQMEAAQRCQDKGEYWALGDRRDFEDLGGELLKAGHRGSFWTASRRPNENLDFFLEPDGSSSFRWALSANDTKRIVLCVRAAAL